jgi:aspartate 1-decarboxylase
MVLRTYLAGKIHGIRLTNKNVSYVGSLTLSRDYLDASGIAEHEVVHVVNTTTGARLTTYVIVTDEPGQCVLNGGAARLGEIGDEMIVMAFAQSDRPLTPKVVIVGDRNRIQRTIVEAPNTTARDQSC